MPRTGGLKWQTKQFKKTVLLNATCRKRHGRLYPKKEREETDAKKRAGSRKGKQFVSNTEKAKKAGRAARRYKDQRKSKKLVKKAIKNAHLYSRAEILYFKMWLELKKQAKTAKINKDK